MPTRPTATRRWLTAATWPAGIALTSWDYMWRSTPLHRSETAGDALPEGQRPATRSEGSRARTEVHGT